MSGLFMYCALLGVEHLHFSSVQLENKEEMERRGGKGVSAEE